MAENKQRLIVARGSGDVCLLAAMANRHGLIAGATGTGKTISLRVLAEALSQIGTPVVLADVKGDLSGLAAAGGDNPKVEARVRDLGLEGFSYSGYPVAFWDVLGTQGLPLRATISEIGPLLLGRLLGLNETQSGVLTLVFKVADDNGLLLLDLKDLRSLLDFVGSNAAQFKTKYGNVSAASVGAIQRGLLTLEQQGGDRFFGEPALCLDDLLQTDADGRGVINILAADRLIQTPKLYATALLWILSELFENLPEVGDVERPKLVFFFDEAHLLFDDAPKALVDKIEQVVRLVRSKGVGVYFVTQSPLDLPEVVLGQLGNRVQHALRAFTPKDQKSLKAVAETFRANPAIDVGQALGELAVGEALVSLLDDKGIPGIVERTWILPPRSRLTPLTEEERQRLVRASSCYAAYEKSIDRESAYEVLRQRAQSSAPQAPETSPSASPSGAEGQAAEVVEAFVKSAARAVGSQLGRQIIRGVLGSFFGGRRRR